MTEHDHSLDRRIFWGLLLVLAVGVAARALHLGAWDMWTDEVQTLRMAASGEFWFGPMYSTAPINFWVTGWAVELLGADEIGLRIVPFLSGSLTLAFFFTVFRRWLGDRGALLGTTVLALSFWHVAWSQTGRHFALQTLWMLGAIWGFLRYWEDERKVGLAAAAVCLLGALFTHSSSGFYVVALLAVVALDALRRWKSLEVSGAGFALRSRTKVAGTVLLGLIAIYLPIYFGVGAFLLEARSAWNPPWNIVGSLGFYVTPVVVAFAAAGAFSLWKRSRQITLTLVSVAILPPVLLAVASAITIASAAYCLPSMLAVAALAGAGCDGLLRAASDDGAAFLGAAVVVAGLFLAQAEDLVEYHFFQNGLKPRWVEATRYVEEHREPGEEVWAAEGDVAEYYLGSEDVGWLGEYRSSADSLRRGTGSGSWFITYLQATPDLGAMSAPVLRRGEFPEAAKFRALFPVHYGPKNRTLVVLYRGGQSRGGADPGGSP